MAPLDGMEETFMRHGTGEPRAREIARIRMRIDQDVEHCRNQCRTKGYSARAVHAVSLLHRMVLGARHGLLSSPPTATIVGIRDDASLVARVEHALDHDLPVRQDLVEWISMARHPEYADAVGKKYVELGPRYRQLLAEAEKGF